MSAKKSILVSLTLGAFMLLAGGLTKYMTPTNQSDLHSTINLESMIPVKFADWRIDPSSEILLINPETQATISKLYSQTLTRSYINQDGERVMLSIAYGLNQSTDLHIHRPEICYLATGFEIGPMSHATVETKLGRIPVTRLVAKQAARIEPITYWIRVGNSITSGWLEQKLAAIIYTITGAVPDGLLFRISTISNDEHDSYRLQQSFLTAMLQAVRSEDRYWLVGQLSP